MITNRTVILGSIGGEVSSIQSYKGLWNADTNTPTIQSGVGTAGDFYIVSVAGTTEIDGINTWNVGDRIEFNGTVWERLEDPTAGEILALRSDIFDNVSDNMIPMKSAGVDEFEDSSFTETTEFVESSKTLMLPPDSLLLGESVRMSSAFRSILLRNEATGETLLTSICGYDNTGSLPFNHPVFESQTIDVRQAVDTVTAGSGNLTFELSVTENRLIQSIVFRASNTGSFTIVARYNNASGKVIYDMDITVGSIGDMTLNLPAPYLEATGDTIHITITGDVLLLGGNVGPGSSFIPYYSVTGLIYSEFEIHTDEDFTKELHSDTSEPTGFIDRNGTSLSFVNATRTFTLEVATTKDYYIKGQKYTLTGNVNYVIPDTEGLIYIYLQDDGTLNSITTFDIPTLLRDNAFVSIVYWDATNNLRIYFADERHGATMDWATHSYLHNVFGARFDSGLALNSIVADGDGSSDTHAQFGYDAGVIRDEDLIHNISADTAPSQIPIFYRSGTTNVRRKEADNFPLIYDGDGTWTGVSGRPAYNENVAGSWQLSEVGTNDFWLVHYFATNDIEYPVIGWLGIESYGNVTIARDMASEEINQLSGLPFAEFTPIATVIFGTNSYANTANAVIRSIDVDNDYVDWRGAFDVASNISASEHNNLSNRDAANAHPALAIGYSNTIGGTVVDNVDDALDELEIHNNLDGRDTADTHPATSISYSNTIGGTSIDNVDDALDALETHNNLEGRSTTDTHPATAISYSATIGGVVVNNVSEALDELSGAGHYDEPRLTNFSMDIPPRIDIGTDLNVATGYSFFATHINNIDGDLTLVVTTGDNKTISAPFTEGQNAGSVTLSGIVTSSATTVTFQLTGTDTNGGTIQSNVVSIDVSDVPVEELLYWNTQTSSNAADFDTGTADSQEITGSTNTITIATFTGNRYLGIAQPATETDFTQINIGGVNQIGAFTKNSGAITVNTESYDVWLSNNALDGTIVSGEIIGLVR